MAALALVALLAALLPIPAAALPAADPAAPAASSRSRSGRASAPAIQRRTIASNSRRCSERRVLVS